MQLVLERTRYILHGRWMNALLMVARVNILINTIPSIPSNEGSKYQNQYVN